MFKKASGYIAIIVSLITLNVAGAYAHVVVQPNTVGVGKFQTFTTGVPNEKEIPVIGLRLLIPDTLKYVSPNVKTSWQIDTKKNVEGEDAKVTEISWTGGSIPAGFRDEFSFSAQVPAAETSLQWKAYQTYQDGTVVAWDQAPNTKNSDDDSITPYSETKVVNDLTTTTALSTTDASTTNRSNVALIISILSLALGAYALIKSGKK